MPLITKGKSNYIYILIAIIVAALTVCGILIYVENYNNELYLLNQSVGMKQVEKNQVNIASWNTYENSGISFSYPGDVWQTGEKNFAIDPDIKSEGYLLNKKINNCESWIGISVSNEMCGTQVQTIGSGCGGDDVVVECETPKTWETKTIKLNDKISVERAVWTVYTEEKIEAWYDIYDKNSNIYCAALFGLPNGWNECLNDFEQILKTSGLSGIYKNSGNKNQSTLIIQPANLGTNGSNKSTSTDETADWDLNNAEYFSITYPEVGKFKLINGDYFISAEELYPNNPAFKGSATGIEIRIYKDKIAFGDLNGDGKKDAAVILTANGGGSGDFHELAIMLNEGKNPLFLTSVALGDRVIINSIDIQSGVITLDMVVQGPNDSMCCPTLKKIVKYKLSGNQLVEI